MCLVSWEMELSRDVTSAAEVIVNRPEAIALYNTFMGGVDMSDQ